MIPAVSSESPGPSIVNVFPAEVCPYANTVPAMPAHRHARGRLPALCCLSIEVRIPGSDSPKRSRFLPNPRPFIRRTACEPRDGAAEVGMRGGGRCHCSPPSTS